MSVKSQLTACRDFLMVGMRASERAGVHHEQSEKNIRACLDLLEQLVRSSENVKGPEVETTLNVLNRAAAELDADEASPPAVVSALRNAVSRMQALKSEMSGAGKPSPAGKPSGA
jgi:hypothetical protein